MMIKYYYNYTDYGDYNSIYQYNQSAGVLENY